METLVIQKKKQSHLIRRKVQVFFVSCDIELKGKLGDGDALPETVGT